MIFYYLIHLVGLSCAINAIYSSRTSQSAIAWSIILISLPYLGIPFFLLFGPRKYKDIKKSLEEANKEYREIVRLEREKLLPYKIKAETIDQSSQASLEQIATDCFITNNSISLLKSADITFQEILDSIDNASSYIFISTYILRNDKIGQKFKNALIRAAKRKVKVCFLFDALGSFQLSSYYIKELRDSGIEIKSFSSVTGVYNRFKLHFRNHRKICVIDGNLAFIGGFNIGDEYLGKIKSIGNWRDTHVKITGPIVKQIQLTFCRDWYWTTEEVLKADWSPQNAKGKNMTALTLPTGPVNTTEDATLLLLEAIISARKRLWIASPYLVPDSTIMNALCLAYKRGVDVRIILPQKYDHLIVWLAGNYFAQELLERGIKIFLYQDGFYHPKMFLIDDSISSIGSANLDNRSLHLNFELSVLIDNKDFNKELEKMFLDDFDLSTKIDKKYFESQSLSLKFISRFARLFSPLL